MLLVDSRLYNVHLLYSLLFCVCVCDLKIADIDRKKESLWTRGKDDD